MKLSGTFFFKKIEGKYGMDKKYITSVNCFLLLTFNSNCVLDFTSNTQKIKGFLRIYTKRNKNDVDKSRRSESCVIEGLN